MCHAISWLPASTSCYAHTMLSWSPAPTACYDHTMPFHVMPCGMRAAHTCAPNFRHAVVHFQTMHSNESAEHGMWCTRNTHACAKCSIAWANARIRFVCMHTCCMSARIAPCYRLVVLGMQRASFVAQTCLAARNRILLYRDAA